MSFFRTKHKKSETFLDILALKDVGKLRKVRDICAAFHKNTSQSWLSFSVKEK